MLKYVVKRIGISILILLGVSVILYALLRCMPTDFIESKIIALAANGVEVTEEFKQALYSTYGLDGSIISGYFTWLLNVFKGDFGSSFISQAPVITEIFSADKLGVSFMISAIAVVFEFMIAIPLGVTAATHQYSIRDYVVTVLVLIGIFVI